MRGVIELMTRSVRAAWGARSNERHVMLGMSTIAPGPPCCAMGSYSVWGAGDMWRPNHHDTTNHEGVIYAYFCRGSGLDHHGSRAAPGVHTLWQRRARPDPPGSGDGPFTRLWFCRDAGRH